MKPTQTPAAMRCTGALLTAPALSSAIMDGDGSNWSGTTGELWTDSVAGVVATEGGGNRCN